MIKYSSSVGRDHLRYLGSIAVWDARTLQLLYIALPDAVPILPERPHGSFAACIYLTTDCWPPVFLAV